MIETLKTLLQADANVQFAYLFGSYAKEEAREESDVNIAVYLLDRRLEKQLELMHTLQKAVGKKIDIVVLNDVKNLYLLESILKEGILLKDSPDRPMFEVESNLAILDFKAFRRYIEAFMVA